jgi:hypothetical protein
VGLKATYGRIPAWPASMHGDLANTGPMTRTTRDAALMLNVLKGADVRDPLALPPTDVDFVAGLDRSLKGLKVGLVLKFGDFYLDPEVEAAILTAADRFRDLGCEVVLMHMLGLPMTMQQAPRYDDVVGEVEAFLLDRAQAAMDAGVDRSRIWLDPGIGFGKTPQHNLALLAALPRFVGLGFRVLLGASRKRFIAALDPAGAEPDARLGGSLAAALAGATAGVAAVRVHDVRQTVQALTLDAAIRGAG